MKLYSMLCCVFFLLFIFIFSSCNNKSPDAVFDMLLSEIDPNEREDFFHKVQSGMQDSDAKKAADALIQSAQRQKTVKSGLIREKIDFTPLTTEYFATQPSEFLQIAGREDDSPLAIQDFGPVGELPVENKRPNIYVMFNKPMVPLAQLGKPILESNLLRINPPVEGVYRWYGTKTLGFRPSFSLQEHPLYTITIAGDAVSLSGKSLGENFSFDIFSERIKIVNIFPDNSSDRIFSLYDVPTHLAQKIHLQFNQPIDPSHIAQSISVTVDKQAWNYTVSSSSLPEIPNDHSSILLTLEKEPPENTFIRVHLEIGAAPFANYPQTSRVQTHHLKTIRPFKSMGLKAYSRDFPQNNQPTLYPVYLSFSHSLEEGLVPKEFQIEINGKRVKSSKIDVELSRIALYLADIAPGMEVKVTIPDGIRDIYGREAVPSQETVIIPRPKPMVHIPHHYDGLRHLEAEFSPALVWSSRNIVEGQFGIEGKTNYFDNPGFNPPMKKLDLSKTHKDVTFFHQENLLPYLNPSKRGTVFLNYLLQKDPSQVDASQKWIEDKIAVQVTNLGITVRAAYNRVLVWVNQLSDGRAVKDAEITVFNLFGKQYFGSTDADGLAVITIPPGEFAKHFYNNSWTHKDSVHIRAEKSGDLAEIRVTDNHSAYSFGVNQTIKPEYAENMHHRIHFFTDRGLYKGGEELALRGIHWLQDPSGFTSYTGPYTITIIASDTDKIIWSETGKTNQSGSFSNRLKLPDDLEPGNFIVEYKGLSFSRRVSFRIASFRRVNFQVFADTEKKDYIHGETIEASVRAESLSGGVLQSAPYHYFWTRKPFQFIPPGPQWKNWTFGIAAWAGEQTLSSGDGNLSDSGTTHISEETVAHEMMGNAYRYTLETTIKDVDRQVVTARTAGIVHPAPVYIGARFSHGSVDGWWSKFVAVGESVTAVGKLVNTEGQSVNIHSVLNVGLIKKEWKSVQQQGLYGRINTRWEDVKEEVWNRTLSLKDGEAHVTFTPDAPGRYTLFMEYTDTTKRISRTEIDFYASGSGWVATAGQTPQDINMIVDKNLYKSGDIARILVQSPIPSGRYLLTIEREGILDQRIIALSGAMEVIEIPIEEHYLPVVYVALSSFTERTGTEDDYFEPDLEKPRDLFGITTLQVATTPVELDVEVSTVKDIYKPGDKAKIIVTVKHDDKAVAGAEVTVLAVDRGVLDLIDYHIPNPLDYFYQKHHFPLGSIGDDSRRLLLRPVTYKVATLNGGGGSKLDERKDFNPLALFEPSAITGADGTVRLTVTLPDTLSTYRLTALALDGTRLGLSEGEFQVSNPVNIRTALPRKFRNRDSAASGLVLTNTTDQKVDLKVSVESDILHVAGDTIKHVALPGKTSLELPFLFEAHEKGHGEVRFTIKSDILNEVLVEQIEVEQPIVIESVSTIGIADAAKPAEETVQLPKYSAEGYGGLSFSADSSLLPYIEPSLNNILDEEYPSINGKLYKIAAEIRLLGTSTSADGVFGELARNQFQDGGIGYYSPTIQYSQPSWFLSVLTAYTANKFAAENLTNSLDFSALDTYLLDRLKKAESKKKVSFLAAWTALILAEKGMVEKADLQWLYDSEDSLGISGYGILSQAYMYLGYESMAMKLYKRCKNFMTFGTQSVTITETYELRDYFSNNEAELSIFLATATAQGEDSELLMRIAGALNQNRNSRRFHSLFDDFWIVEGFQNLLQKESKKQITSLRVELDDETLIQSKNNKNQSLSIRESFPFTTRALSNLETETPLKLRIIPKGTGQIYYGATLRYALPVETALPRDEGIEVHSRIENLNGDVLDPRSLPLGETLRVRINLSTLVRRSFLKLTVPVPSGSEIVDARFNTSSSYNDAGGTETASWTRETVYDKTATFVEEGYGSYGPDGWHFWFYRPMQKIYDNAVTYVWEDFYPGQREITFLIRTTTPGIYPTPPVSATTEFEPEVFGRDAGLLAIIHSE